LEIIGVKDLLPLRSRGRAGEMGFFEFAENLSL
jgi:hypothetical protein